MDAAVKVIKPQDPGNTFKRSREACVEDVMKEIFVMEKVASFGGHPNLLKLLAKDINIENPLIATEFCTYSFPFLGCVCVCVCVSVCVCVCLCVQYYPQTHVTHNN